MDLFLKKFKNLFMFFSNKREKMIFVYLVVNVCWLFFGMFLYNYAIL